MKTCKTKGYRTTMNNHKIGSKEYRTVSTWRLCMNKIILNIEILWIIIRKCRKSYGKDSIVKL